MAAEYDIIVVGGGPAGSSAAYAAAKSGRTVALLEREESIARTVRTSGVTWISDAEQFGIPPECYNPVRNYSFCSPNNEVTIRGKTPRAAVLDVRRTYRWLASQARSCGAEIMTGATVTGAARDGGAISVRARTAGGERALRSRMVIDASGFQSVVSRSLGLAAPWGRFGAGAEYEVRAENIDPHTWWLMVGQEYSPAGYAWIFPLGDDVARVGVGVGKPESAVDPTRRLDELLRNRPGPLASLGRMSKLEFHYGVIPNGGTRRHTVHDGLLLVGDSAGQANPLVLEGIRYAIRFGRLAGTVAAGAVRRGDTSRGALCEYERQWRGAVQSRLRAAAAIQNRWMGLTDGQWDAELDVIKELDADEFVDFVRADFSVSRTARLAARHPRLAARQLFGTVRGMMRRTT